MKEINEILDFFQNLNEFIYVADIETHELVYMNKKNLGRLRIYFCGGYKRKALL